ncbi:MAG TPA: tetratricopeptide repeat protein [Chthoniobacteraceae bacterium]|nr:tetratricopeptide repeat protein [Chthoniobacteraceae bacterium]
MSPTQELIEALTRADEAGHVAYTRQLCEKILAQWPDHGPTLLRHASALIDLALYDEAAAVLERAASVVPTGQLRLVFAGRGHRLKQMGNFAAAEEEYLKAHQLDPDNATYLVYAGSAAFCRGDLSRAEALVRKALDCSEGSLDEAYFNLGGYLLAQKRFAEARDCYLRALEIDPQYLIAKTRLADVELAITSTANRPEKAP